MADSDLERRKSGMGWLWWAVGLLALVLIVWWAWPAGNEAELALEDAEPTAEVQPLTEPDAETVGEQPLMTLGEIVESPTAYTGQTWTSEVNVTDVPTDRGFWIEDQGERLFVLIIDQPQEQPFEVQPNTTLRLEQAVVREPSFLAELPGAPLDADTEATARDQAVLLTVDESNIRRVQQGEQGQGGM